MATDLRLHPATDRRCADKVYTRLPGRHKHGLILHESDRTPSVAVAQIGGNVSP